MSARTDSQAAASRQNGSASHGPTSDDGKSRSAVNSVRHGLSSSVALLLPGEDVALYEQLLESWFEALRPATVPEGAIVARIGDAAWKLERLSRIEHSQQLALLEDELMKTDVFKNFSLAVRALQAVNAMVAAVGNSRPPSDQHKLAAFIAAGRSVLDIVRDAEVQPLVLEELHHSIERLASKKNPEEVTTAFREVGESAERVAAFLRTAIDGGKRGLETQREKLAAEVLLLREADNKKFERHRRSIEKTMAQQLALLRVVRDQTVAAQASAPVADGHELRLRLRLVK